MSNPIDQRQIRHHIRLFFQRHQAKSRRKLYELLLEEVEGLLQATHQSSVLPQELAKLSHRLKGVCCYLNIEEHVMITPDLNLDQLRLSLQALHDSILAIADEI